MANNVGYLTSDRTDDSIEYDKESFTIVNDLSGILELYRVS